MRAVRQKLLREDFWPGVKTEQLWSKTRKGYASIPRPLPIILVIMDFLAPKNKPVSTTYLDLWCRTFEEPVVKMNRQSEMAISSGFSGQRRVRTWEERVKILRDLGFLKLAPGPDGPLSFALILNPYLILKKFREQKPNTIPADLFNSFIARMHEVGAEDLAPTTKKTAASPVARRRKN